MSEVTTAPSQPTFEAEADRHKRLDREDLIAVLNTPSGQAVFWRILEHAHPYEANRAEDEFRRGIQEGERRIALWLIALIEDADAAGLAKMMAEAGVRAAKRAQDDAAIAAAQNQAQAEADARMSIWERSRRLIMARTSRPS
jgi:hypothetical protein